MRGAGRSGRLVGVLGVMALASALALALLAGLAFTATGGAMAQGDTACNQGDLQTALTNGQATITFAPGCTIDLTSALTINAGVNVTIDGNGLTLVGANTTTDVIDIDDQFDASTLSLDQVTVEDGQNGIYDSNFAATVKLTASSVSRNSADGIDAGSVTLTNSSVSNSSGAVLNGNDYTGYGVQANSVTLSGSTVSGNQSTGVFATGAASVTGSTVSSNGRGILSTTATVTDSTVSNNGTQGIETDADASVTDSTVSGNGGYGIDAIGNVTVTGSTVDNNDADGIFNSGNVTATNSTISDNHGDGIYPGEGVTLTESTLSGNGTWGVDYADPFVSTASLLAGNSSGSCNSPVTTDDGYNLSSDTSCGFNSSTSLPNAVSTTPPTPSQLNLQPLANNGGPTQTQALGSGSIAIDAIPVNGENQCLNAADNRITDPTTSTPITTDQRGVPRPQGATCDIGAYELIQGSYTVTESTCPTQAQLQDDLDLATSGSPLTIDLPANCTIKLTSSLTIGAGVNITINGNSLTLDGQTKTFDDIAITDTPSQPSTLTLNQVTIEDGAVGIQDMSPGTNAATVQLTASTISGNGQDGFTAGTAVVTGSTLSGNGGYGIVTSGEDTVTDSTISGNGYDGISEGGNGAVTVTDSTIAGNGGNGIFEGGNGAGMVTMSTIAGNGRSGILAGESPMTLTASILADNKYDCLGPVTDDGYNRSTDDTCGFTATGSANNVPTTGAGGLNLLPLGNYGGPTQTIALGPGSIAIDAIPTGTSDNQTVCLNAAGNPITDPTTGDPIMTDQRGIDRPQGSTCDVGAYEAPAVTIATTPSTPASTGWYNASQLGVGGTLSVTASFTGLASGELPSCSGATFNGLPATAVTGLNQSASGSTSLGDGAYSLSCGVAQGTTVLGVSQNVPQPLILKIDTTPPVITSPTSQQYTAGTSVPLTCVDPTPAGVNAVSGLNTCQVTVKEPNGSSTTVNQGNDIPTGPAGRYTVTPDTVTDMAGNSDTTSFSYTVAYRIVPLPGSSLTVRHDYYALIRVAPEDVNGRDLASRTLTAETVELDGPNGQRIQFVYPMRYGTFSGKPGYQIEINTRNLSLGTWTLKFTLGGATQVIYTTSFTVIP